MGARKVFFDKVKTHAKEVRNGRYFVKRGVINWATFPFTNHAFAMSLLCDDTSFMKVNGVQDMSFSIEAATSIPDSTAQPEIDDGVMDSMIEDVETILNQVRADLDSHSNSIALMVDTESARIVEFHDSALRVQGIVATLIVKF